MMRPGWPKILACPYTLEDREGIDIDLLNAQNEAVLLIPDAIRFWPEKFQGIECKKWMYLSSTVGVGSDVYDDSVGGYLKGLVLNDFRWKDVGDTEALPDIFRAARWWFEMERLVQDYALKFDMTFLDCWFESLSWIIGPDPYPGAWKEYLVRMRRMAKGLGNRIIINGFPHGSRRTLSGRMIENVPNKASWFPLLFGGHGIYDAAQNKEYMHPRTVIISEFAKRHRRICLALSMILGTYMAPKGNSIIQVLENPGRDAGMWLPKGPYSISDDGQTWKRLFRHWKTGEEYTVTVGFHDSFRAVGVALPFGVV